MSAVPRTPPPLDPARAAARRAGFSAADFEPQHPGPATQARRPRSLRREIVAGYSIVLLVALTLFAAATYLILRQTLASAGTQSLRQTALAAE